MTEGSSTYTVQVAADKAGSRLDRLLADALPEISRSRLKALIEAASVEAPGRGPVVDPALRVRAGETFVVVVPAPPPAVPRPQSIPLEVVYEDDQLIVVDKPAGLVVHPGAGNPDGTLVNALLAHCGSRLSSIGAPLRPGIVHRLDKDTSGLLVVAKTDAAHLCLARQFAAHEVRRAYRAVAWGNPLPAAGRIHTQIARSGHDRTKMTIVRRGGKAAITTYETVARYGTLASLIECRLSTGRTHQIRVHLAAVGHPIIGDGTYGRQPRPSYVPAAVLAFPRQALHAFLIGFRHPNRPISLAFVSWVPSDLNRLMRILEEM